MNYNVLVCFSVRVRLSSKAGLYQIRSKWAFFSPSVQCQISILTLLFSLQQKCKIRPSQSPECAHAVTALPQHRPVSKFRGWKMMKQKSRDDVMVGCCWIRRAQVNVSVWGFFGSTVRCLFFLIQSVSRLSFLSVVGHLIRQKAVHKTTVKETKKKTKKKN